MRIAVIGPPSVDKCSFASTLADKIEHHFIDSPHQQLRDHGRELNDSASYHEYLLAHAMTQLELDQHPEDVVVLDGILQYWAELATAVETHPTQYTDPASIQRILRLTDTLKTMSFLLGDTFFFDLIFFIRQPLDEVPEPLNRNEEIQRILSRGIDWLGDTLSVSIMDNLPLSEQLELALEAIDGHNTAQNTGTGAGDTEDLSSDPESTE